MRRAVAADRAAAGHPAAGDVHDDRERPERLRGGDGCADGVIVEDVARDRLDPIAELRGQGVGETGIPVEHHHAHAEAGQPPHGG